MKNKLRGVTAAVAVAVGATIALTGCSNSSTLSGSSASGSTKSIVVGSANFGENEVLAEVYGQALAAKGWKVTYKLSIGARAAYIADLKAGSINLIPEYAGSILSYLDSTATGKSSGDVASELKSALPSGLAVLKFSSAADADSLNVTPAFAKANDLSSISDLSSLSSVTLAANPEFETRPDGIPGLKSVYGLSNINFQAINDSGGPATLKALLDNTVQVADIYSTTPSILSNKLVTLKDPKNLFASQQIVPIVTSKKVNSTLTSTLNKVSAKLTTKDLLEFNTELASDSKPTPASVASKWVKANGFNK